MSVTFINSKRVTEWQIAFWVVFLVFFIAAGALPLDKLAWHRRVANHAPTNSMDLLLREEFAIADGAETLRAALNDVPKSTPVTMIYPVSGRASLAGMVVSQLVWPRPVKEVRFDSPFATKVDFESVRERGGIAVCMLVKPPRELGEMERLSPNFSIVRINPTR
jgi:hypothetical protein